MLQRILLLMLFSASVQGQDLVHYDPMKAEPVGGSAQLEQVLETQLSLPKNFFLSGYHDDLRIYFNIDSAGKAHNILVKGNFNNKVAKQELTRLMHLMSFQRQDRDPKVPYYIEVTLSAAKYNACLKQKFKSPFKTRLPADSSCIVYSRADRSPEYYRSGEEGLKEYVLENLEYPKVAIEKGVEGTVILEFIVETNGFVTAIQPKHMVGAGCTDEAIRLAKKLRFIPAQLNGHLVRYRMSYPITFSLRNANRDNGFSNPAVGN